MKEWLKALWAKIKAFIGIDGVLHFGICYAIVVTFGLMDYIAGIIFAFGLSVFKECWDYSREKKQTGEWNWRHSLHDLLFDFIGIGLGVAICIWLK